MTTIILLILGIILLIGSISLFIVKKATSTSDINRVFIFGWVGAAILRLFWEPTEYTWIGWKKNVLATVLLIAALVCLYGSWLANRII